MLLSTGRMYGTLGGGGGGPTYPLDGLTFTGAWSMSRDLYTAFIGGSRYTDASGDVASLNDQSGNSRHMTEATFRPLASTAGPNSRACADFSGGSFKLTGAALSNFIAAGTGYIVVSGIFDAISSNNVNPYQNDIMVVDSGGYIAIAAKNTAGSPETLQCYTFDTGNKTAEVVGLVAGTAYVMEWKHESGNISARLNGGSWVDVASGNTGSLAGLLRFGTSDSKLFECAITSTLPTSPQQDAIVADFKSWIGA